MNNIKLHRAAHALAALALVTAGAATPAWAASSAASSASDSVTTSVGSFSGSIEKSSASSAGDKKVADGDYRVIDVATLADRPGIVRMKLHALADRGAEGEFFLYMPQAVFDESRLAQGGIVTARNKAYGVEFAETQTRQAFFLVLSDEWYRELQTTPVVL